MSLVDLVVVACKWAASVTAVSVISLYDWKLVHRDGRMQNLEEEPEEGSVSVVGEKQNEKGMRGMGWIPAQPVHPVPIPRRSTRLQCTAPGNPTIITAGVECCWVLCCVAACAVLRSQTGPGRGGLFAQFIRVLVPCRRQSTPSAAHHPAVDLDSAAPPPLPVNLHSHLSLGQPSLSPRPTPTTPPIARSLVLC